MQVMKSFRNDPTTNFEGDTLSPSFLLHDFPFLAEEKPTLKECEGAGVARVIGTRIISSV